MKNKVTILVLLFSLSLLMSCDKRKEKSVGIQYCNTIMPLAKGNHWVYIDSIFVDGEVDSVEETKIGITGANQIAYQSKDFWVYHWTWYDMPDDNPQERKSLVTNEDDGLVYYGQKMGSNFTEFHRRLFIKYPVTVDEQWNYTPNTTIKCVSTSTTFETPAGIFEAYKYLFRQGEERQYLYYVPEIGYVGMEKVQDGKTVVKRQLIEYNVIKDS